MYETKTTASDWDKTLITLSKGPSESESQKCENTENAIRKAITSNAKLSQMDISIFAQGSYKARTNVRAESDVDIAVLLNTVAYNDYPVGLTAENFGFTPAKIEFIDFKNLVKQAMEEYFGYFNIDRSGKKSIKVHSNTYRVDADVVPMFCHNHFLSANPDDCLRGVAFSTNEGMIIKNWPQQNYENGIQKNTATKRKYKRLIRILKRLKAYMIQEGIQEANIPSYLIECLVWNVPNVEFFHDSLYQNLRQILFYLWDKTRTNETCSKWGEVNELKYLFSTSQPWTFQQAHNFILATWKYIGYK